MNFIEKFVAKIIVGRVLKMFGFLDGYKTIIAGGLMVLTGIAQMIGVAPETFQTGSVGWELVMEGLAVIGLRGGIAKIK